MHDYNIYIYIYCECRTDAKLSLQVIDQDDARLTRSASPLNSNADPNQNGDQDEIQEPLVTAFGM